MERGLELTFAIQLVGAMGPLALHRTRAMHGEQFGVLSELKKIRLDGRAFWMLAVEFGLDSGQGGYGRQRESGSEWAQKGWTDIECWCMLHGRRGTPFSFCLLPCSSSLLRTGGPENGGDGSGRRQSSRERASVDATRRVFLSRVRASDQRRRVGWHRQWGMGLRRPRLGVLLSLRPPRTTTSASQWL